VGTLRTSEEGNSAAGEGRKSATTDDDRRVDGGAKIVIESGPISTAALPAPVTRPRTPPRATPVVPARRGGLGLVIVLYLLAAAALGYAIYERYYL
jgi:hypothetical protein